MARLIPLHRHRRAVPVSAGACQQPDRHHSRHPARRLARSACRVDRLLRAVGVGDDLVRLWRREPRRHRACAMAARPQDRRGCCRCQRGVGHGAQFMPRPWARYDRGRRRVARVGSTFGCRADWRDHCRRADRLVDVSGRCRGRGCTAGGQDCAVACSRCIDRVFHPAFSASRQ